MREPMDGLRQWAVTGAGPMTPKDRSRSLSNARGAMSRAAATSDEGLLWLWSAALGH